MIPELEQIDIPEWLACADALSIDINPFPLNEILSDSLYYPSSSFDGDPIKFLAGNFLSFIYVDYGHTKRELHADINNRGCKGFYVVASRELTEKDLAPNGWTPVQPLPNDGNPQKRSDWIKQPFATWMVFQRKADFPKEHGPIRFSLLYLCADGVAAFQALCLSNNAVPKAVAIIQPGTGFGGNWTDFRDPELIFGRSVLQNPAGKPRYLLFGEGNRSPKSCWSEYGRLVKMLWTGSRQIGVWEKCGES